MGKIVNRKLILIIMVLMLIISLIPIKSLAATSLSEMMGQARNFVNTGKNNSTNVDPKEIAEEFVPLGQILTTIGMGVMIAVTTFLGIKYLTASPEGQAKLKQQLIGLVVSGIVVFGAYYIWKLAVTIVQSFD